MRARKSMNHERSKADDSLGSGSRRILRCTGNSLIPLHGPPRNEAKTQSRIVPVLGSAVFGCGSVETLNLVVSCTRDGTESINT